MALYREEWDGFWEFVSEKTDQGRPSDNRALRQSLRAKRYIRRQDYQKQYKEMKNVALGKLEANLERALAGGDSPYSQ